MKDYIEFKEFGECEIDVEKVIKKFTLLHRIFQWRNEFYLVEYTPKCKRKLKVCIKETDAKEIIKKLNLKAFKDDLFVNAITYVPVG